MKAPKDVASEVEAIVQGYMRVRPAPDEVTVAMMAARLGCDLHEARAALEAAFKAGKLTRRRVWTDGSKEVWAYRAREAES